MKKNTVPINQMIKTQPFSVYLKLYGVEIKYFHFNSICAWGLKCYTLSESLYLSDMFQISESSVPLRGPKFFETSGTFWVVSGASIEPKIHMLTYMLRDYFVQRDNESVPHYQMFICITLLFIVYDLKPPIASYVVYGNCLQKCMCI